MDVRGDVSAFVYIFDHKSFARSWGSRLKQ